FHRTGDGLRVSNDKVVSIEYTLKLADNTVQDSNVGKDPLRFVYGSNDVIPGLELALAGMRVGDSKHVVVKPEDGYGPSDPEKLREISKDKLPPDAMVVGSQIQGQNASGKVINAWISEIKEDTAILNFNHRLAGQTLYFDVKVVDIKEME
ncbi:MAG: peptidylprolyl isomerase, partial [Planctomycetes bacterium]|nr:peptidylprolyl isomerase [Planctomycetota bacterium]